MTSGGLAAATLYKHVQSVKGPNKDNKQTANKEQGTVPVKQHISVLENKQTKKKDTKTFS